MNQNAAIPCVRLHGKGLARRVQRGHRWVFSNEVAGVDGDPASGDTVEVQSSRGDFLGVGAWSPHSLIRVRIWSSRRETLDGEFLRARIQTALDRRRELFRCEPLAGRIIFSEGDGLPGLIVDRFGDILSIQMLSTGVEARRETIQDILEEIFTPAAIVERSDTPSRDHEGLPRRSGVVRGALETDPVTFSDPRDGLTYLAPLLAGQKTGFFFDQWANRSDFHKVSEGASGEGDAKGKRVLDAFCYTGAWGLQAAAGGARSVHFLDSSASSLEYARQQLEINGLRTPHEIVQANAFDYLKESAASGVEFDLIALDPPAFAKSRKHIKEAVKGYREINLRAMRLVAKGGDLFTCTCSHHVDAQTFYETVALAGANSGREFVVVKELVQSPDHPVLLGMPETRYLKGLHLHRIN